MLDYIDENFTLPLTLQQVAEHIHCSISTVKRDMNDFVGLSFSEYLLQMRIKKACFLLRTTALPLSVVAMQSGFQEVGYFHLQFSMLIKETPAKYRRKHTT